MQVRFPWLGVAIVASLCHPAAAVAQEFVVEATSGDGVDAAPGDGLCMTSTGSCSLRAAIQESNALPGTQSVSLSTGVHALTIPGRGEDASATGDLDVTDDVAIDSASPAEEVIIDTGGLDRVFDLHGDGTLLTLNDVTIRNGEVLDEPGAGIRNHSDGLALLVRVVLEGNEVLGEGDSAIGGGIGADAGGALLAVDGRFEGNSALRGGAIFSNGSVQLADTTLAGNVASRGSALVALGPTTIERCTFQGNQALQNTTLRVENATAEIRNTTISGNEDPAGLLEAVGTIELENVTIHDNEAAVALRVFGAGTARLVNTVIVDPLATTECQVDMGGVLDSLGNNFDRDGTCTSEPSDLTGPDPGLGPLEDIGGSGLTHRPLPGSPLIDAGSDASCPDVDQRRVSRPRDGDEDGIQTCDIGAVEIPEPGAFAGALAAAAVFARAARRRVERLRGCAGSS